MQSVLSYVTFGTGLQFVLYPLIVSVSAVLGDKFVDQELNLSVRGTAILLVVIGILLLAFYRTIGRMTLSPTLNRLHYVLVVLVVHLIYTGTVLLVLYVILEYRPDQVTAFVLDRPLRAALIVAFVTLVSSLKLQRNLDSGESVSDVRSEVAKLFNNITVARKTECAEFDGDDFKKAVEDIHQSAPEPQFPDEAALYEQMAQLANTFDDIDPESQNDILTGDIESYDIVSDSVSRANVLYKEVLDTARVLS